jgi:hypothetical protein
MMHAVSMLGAGCVIFAFGFNGKGRWGGRSEVVRVEGISLIMTCWVGVISPGCKEKVGEVVRVRM